MTWANRLELDQTPHCLLSTLSEIVNYYPTTLESEMDPAFGTIVKFHWAYMGLA